MPTRRTFLQACGGLATLASGRRVAARAPREAATARSFHLSVSPEALEAAPGMLDAVYDAGVRRIWLPAFFYGEWPFPMETLRDWGEQAERRGMGWSVINIPLGHPGDSLGSKAGVVPLTPPERWRMAKDVDGRGFAGTSIHPPAVAENVDAMRRLAAAGVRNVLLDDDFRLARGPSVVGGCFCDEHRRTFQRDAGLSDSRWDGLIDAIHRRDFTEDLRTWVDHQCDILTGAFPAMRQAAPEVELGNMIMYLGAEKAGIRLADYADVSFRVGELSFADAQFGTLKGKTNELFSALFHRRFATPERAYSETTAFPADALSAPNMAAKLVVSTIADVRHTMFMSGLSGLPMGHWSTLGPAMKRQAEIHAKLAGHRPRGPFKHYWGLPSRYVGDDEPFSLFLAAGVPFEVVAAPAGDGVTFLSAADAARPPSAPGSILVARPADGLPAPVRPVAETLEAVFALKRELGPALDAVPHVEQDAPIVCAWYPTARAALLWNLTDERRAVTIRHGETRREVALGPLESALVEGLQA
jgi:hypothetical protein